MQKSRTGNSGAGVTSPKLRTRRDKLTDTLKNPYRVFSYLAARGWFRRLNDETYLKMMFRARIGRKLRLHPPVTFNEKINWLKLNDNRPEDCALVDKLAVRAILADLLGEDMLVPLLGVWDDPDEIDFSALPDRFVLKCTHDSGGVLICRDKAALDVPAAREKLKTLLRRNYALFGRERQYDGVKPRVIAETYLSDGNDDLTDYKLLCMNGKVKCLFVTSGRRSKNGMYMTFFDADWKRLPFERYYPANPDEIARPVCLTDMIGMTERICAARKLIFARADFFVVNGKPYIGEITLRPGSGFEPFTPEIWDEKLGDMLDLSPMGGNE